MVIVVVDIEKEWNKRYIKLSITYITRKGKNSLDKEVFDVVLSTEFTSLLNMTRVNTTTQSFVGWYILHIMGFGGDGMSWKE